MSEDKGRRDMEAQLVAKAWRDEQFREALRTDARGTIAKEFNTTLSDNIKINVVEEDANTLYIVLPPSPQTAGELSDADLESVAGGEKLAVSIKATAKVSGAVVVGASEAAITAAVEQPPSGW